MSKQTNTNRINLDRYATTKGGFYGKAYATRDADGGLTLYSYGTRILRYRNGDGFKRVWGNWSTTTQRHINAFCAFVGEYDCGGKAWFTGLEVCKAWGADFHTENATAATVAA